MSNSNEATAEWIRVRMRFLLLFSRQGKLRLQKWFSPLTDREKKKIIRDMMLMVLGRAPRTCNFLQWRDLKIAMDITQGFCASPEAILLEKNVFFVICLCRPLKTSTMPPKVSINTEEYVTITQVFVDSSNKRIDDMSKLMYDFKQSLEMTQKDFDDYKASSSTLSKSCNEIRSDLDTICKSLLAFSDKAEHLEGQSKRNNIVIEGIKESGKEAMADCEDKVRKLFIEKLQLDHLKIELDRVYRAGKPLSGNLERPRPVVVRFLRLKDKMAVLDRAKRLKGTGIFINEDFPETVRQKRKELLPAMKAARERGDVAYLKYDKLIVHPPRNLPQQARANV
ncbi:hypothetical protein WMY93_028928 [Mugilogobius chulae]|uniref:AP complex mu/sigma subunit domain-containing protein n=1 Tax=Mugilogobius chulae TaxID=88201 RepID=A0AAW0MYU5_9GOBI